MDSIKTLARTAAGVVTVLALALIVVQQSTKAATNKSTAPVRGYYLTQGTFDGSQDRSACSVGYHMASLWEIHEPSNLRYDTTLGFTADDSGSGPPTGKSALGWIRTGLPAASSGNGLANCNAWTSNASTDFGSTASLSADWEGIFNPPSPAAPWESIALGCDDQVHVRVWCVQD